MAKTCVNCIYKDRKWGDNPCRTCMESGSDNHENWIGIDDEKDFITQICSDTLNDAIIEEFEKIRSAIVEEIKDRNNDSNNKDIVVGLSMTLAIIQKRLDELEGE